MFGVFGSGVSAGVSALAAMQNATMDAQQQQEIAETAMRARDARDYDNSYMMARADPSATVERIKGVYRCVVASPTRIPQHPKQEAP